MNEYPLCDNCGAERWNEASSIDCPECGMSASSDDACAERDGRNENGHDDYCECDLCTDPDPDPECECFDVETCESARERVIMERCAPDVAAEQRATYTAGLISWPRAACTPPSKWLC